MRKVVLFKSVSEEYRRAFRENNYEPVFVEPLQFTYTNEEELGARLLREEYAGLVLTSVRAVEALAARWDTRRRALWAARNVYAVGAASGDAAQRLLGLHSRGTSAGDGASLADVILKENEEPAKFLFPCGNLRLETLPDSLQSRGLAVDSLTVYETRENEHLRADLMELSELAERPCCLVFFSPSGCEYVHRQLQTFSNQLVLLPHFAIGNSTAHKIENLGLEIAGVSARPIAPSIVESVQRYFTSQSCTS